MSMKAAISLSKYDVINTGQPNDEAYDGRNTRFSYTIVTAKIVSFCKESLFALISG